ncbi:uncharacterized protein [Epargyreus clarus]|uniref:uncharacterized protein n=1 Tax=Epargyreus clarus TaxID=520877 RepID=UPI003C2D4D67
MASITHLGLLALMLVGFATSQMETTTKFSLTETRTANKPKSCTTKLGANGLCVDLSFCNDETYEILSGGNIYDSELRMAGCNGQSEWCCSEKNVTQIPPPKPEQQEINCIVSNETDCPWCVKLYRDGEDTRIPKSGFFCMGTMIGPNVILSTGTCMIQAQRQNLTAVIPSSANPTMKYLVKFRIIHPEYNSGTRANDLALFVVYPDVEWGSSGPKGACIGMKASLTGDCIGAGADDDENIDLTPLLVKSGTCGSGDNLDAACGNVIGDDCSVVPGAPVMCRVNNGPIMMVGLAKLGCLRETSPPPVLLGHLNVAATWLSDTLTADMGLRRKTFTNEAN